MIDLSINKQGLAHHRRGAVPHLPAGDMAVDDGHDGVVRMAAEIVDHHLTAAAELGGDPLRHLAQQLQFSAFRVRSLLFLWFFWKT